METQALLFIPDISGFTKFVTETETRHSKHIISELIEAILESNELGMEVSEIEGDAVLFYRKGNPPKLEELINQAKKMFLDFHTQLKIIQRDNVCQCGACRTAVNLTLKFITHFGYLEEVTIQNFTKIMGSDVILAHRLLKNNINHNEYLLLTDDYLNTQEIDTQQLESWIQFNIHSESFKNFERVRLKYVPLSPIKKEIPDVSKFKKEGYDFADADASIFIKAPLLLVHELLTDHNAKLEYVPGLKGIENQKPINRINSSHTCVFDDLEIHFVTQFNETKDKEITYVEQAELSQGFAFISDYKLKEEADGTRLSLKIIPTKYPNELPFVKKIVNNFLRGFAHRGVVKLSKNNLQKFKEYCERKAVERKSTN